MNKGIPKGEAEEMPDVAYPIRFPLRPSGSPGTIQEVPGDSLHTFSSVRKYDMHL